MNGTQQFADYVDDNWSVNINTTQKKNVEGVLLLVRRLAQQWKRRLSICSCLMKGIQDNIIK
jgi:hypothetical protein